MHERPRLLALAYRLLGSASDAEDVVQEALVRASQRDDLVTPAAFLTTVVTRLCLDEKRSARRRKTHYVGPCLPEPIPTDRLDAPTLADVEYRENVSMAFLVLLDQLSPAERAVFVLAELFDVEMRDIASTLERNEPSCRKLLQRARTHIEAGRRQRVPSRIAQETIAGAFFMAVVTGDIEALATLLAEDAKLVTDHGGTSRAARRTIVGSADVTRFFLGLIDKQRRTGEVFLPEVMPLSGEPGIVLRRLDGSIDTALVLHVTFDGDRCVIGSISSVRDVPKLVTLRAEVDRTSRWSVVPNVGER